MIDFPGVIDMLRDVGYAGFLTLEYEHDPWQGCDNVDVFAESIKMRDLVMPLLDQ